ncbi:MAG: S8 family serine peptidase [Blastocatellia bacterium]
MKIRLATVLVFVLASVLSINFKTPVLAQSEGAMAKIAPWVIERTTNNQDAEFLVVLADQADLTGADALQTKEEKGRFVYNALFDKAQATQKPLLDWLRQNNIESRSYYIVNMIWVKANRDIAVALASRADVQRIEGNPVIHNNLEPAENLDIKKIQAVAAIEPGITFSHADQVWAIGFTGQGIVVGAADTGYRWDHNALKDHYRGWNGTTADHNFNWHDSIHSGGGDCGANSAQPCDDHGHGTHTAGTAVGDDGAANQVGMAPGAKWIGCRNMDRGNGTPATYIECFEFFLAPYPVGGTPAQGDPTKAPDLTTNSWGCPPSEGCSPASLQAAVTAQRAAGIITVVAAGNSGSGCSTVSDPPGIYAESFTVGALNTGTDSLASFSSRGPVTVDGSNRMKPDIAAPGTSTRSASRTSASAYTSMSGTSMATPHVAGGIALMLSAQPALRGQVSIVENIMRDSAVHLASSSCSSSGSPNNLFGSGRMDTKVATDIALTTFSPKSAAFQVTGGDGVLGVTAPAGTNWTAVSNDSWIIITSGNSGTGNGTVFYSVRDNFNTGFRIGSITIARRNYLIRQDGTGTGNCTNAITPSSQSFLATGGNGTIQVTSGENCIWNATPNVSWITITSDNGGMGSGNVAFTVSANPSGISRKATITVAGRTFSVKQK